jgi:hypothetical protein
LNNVARDRVEVRKIVVKETPRFPAKNGGLTDTTPKLRPTKGNGMKILKTTFVIAAVSCLSLTAVHAREAGGGGGPKSAVHFSAGGGTAHHFGSKHQNSGSSRSSSARSRANHRAAKASNRARDRHRLDSEKVNGNADVNADSYNVDEKVELPTHEHDDDNAMDLNRGNILMGIPTGDESREGGGN